MSSFAVLGKGTGGGTQWHHSTRSEVSTLELRPDWDSFDDVPIMAGGDTLTRTPLERTDVSDSQDILSCTIDDSVCELIEHSIYFVGMEDPDRQPAPLHTCHDGEGGQPRLRMRFFSPVRVTPFTTWVTGWAIKDDDPSDRILFFGTLHVIACGYRGSDYVWETELVFDAAEDTGSYSLYPESVTLSGGQITPYLELKVSLA